jgi:hypothetical protein
MRNTPVSGVPPVQPLIDVLDREAIDDVVAGYWVAYKLTFETKERIVASPMGVVRYPPYLEQIRRAETIGYVYNLSSSSEVGNAETLRSALEEAQQEYEEYPAGSYTLIVPKAMLLPEDLPVAAVPQP